MSGNIFRNYTVALSAPTAWIGVILIIGLVLLWSNRLKAAKVSFTLGTFLFVLFAFDPITEILLNSYENRYPGFELKDHQKPKYIVVLAGGYVPEPESHPLTTRITKSTLVRLIEGIRIHREIPGSILIFTGSGWAKRTEASAMKELAVKLGVDPKNTLLEEESKNTFDHTLYLKKLLGAESFVLVTSAIHMPRAMGLFTKAGYKPIPAPTGHLLTGQYGLFNMKVPFASGDNLDAVGVWFNEFFAINLAKFRDRI